MSLSEVKYLKKVHAARFGEVKAETSADVGFLVESDEYVTIIRGSGSGGVILLNILATLDRPTSGNVVLSGQDMARIPDRRMAAYRRGNLGFVSQSFNLLDTFSLKDSIFLPMVLTRKDYREMEERLAPPAAQLEIGGLLEKHPYEVPGGQKQRVAVARALITRPKILLADEPTGALDSRAADGLLRMFEQANHFGQTVFATTHSTRAASHAGWVLFIKDGTISHQLYRGNTSSEAIYRKILDTLTALATRRGEGGREQSA